jgi:hypothetical protein
MKRHISSELKREVLVQLMLTPAEKDELRIASDRASMPLSVFIRAMALEAARKREANRAA